VKRAPVATRRTVMSTLSSWAPIVASERIAAALGRRAAGCRASDHMPARPRSGAQRTNSRTCAYTVALSFTPECDTHDVCVFAAPDRIVLVSGLMTSSHGDHHVP
jgi:hypothetical protein